eukprot:1160995-Pelagomonas_calceolata.AAC.8
MVSPLARAHAVYRRSQPVCCLVAHHKHGPLRDRQHTDTTEWSGHAAACGIFAGQCQPIQSAGTCQMQAVQRSFCRAWYSSQSCLSNQMVAVTAWHAWLHSGCMKVTRSRAALISPSQVENCVKASMPADCKMHA